MPTLDVLSSGLSHLLFTLSPFTLSLITGNLHDTRPGGWLRGHAYIMLSADMWHLHASPAHVNTGNLHSGRVEEHTWCPGTSPKTLDSIPAHVRLLATSLHMHATHMLTAQLEIPAACAQVINYTGQQHARQSWICIVPRAVTKCAECFHMHSVYI